MNQTQTPDHRKGKGKRSAKQELILVLIGITVVPLLIGLLLS